jgi:hypothetical protein
LPPTDALTGAAIDGKGVLMTNPPDGVEGVMPPSPVPNSDTMLPAAAGLDALL